MEQQRLASLKMNAKLMFIKDSLKDYLKLKDEFFYEVEKTITYSKIKKFARELYKADKVFIIGEICEISLFYELQDILSYNQKKVILPRYLNKKDFDSQINNIDQETLIIVCDGLHCYQDFIYYSSINSGYDHSSLFRNNKKIFIGQKSNIQSDDLITFELSGEEALLLKFSMNIPHLSQCDLLVTGCTALLNLLSSRICSYFSQLVC